ncbi:hypothetical protein F5148DRAFT_1153769 [Russula earlei]|uniref:Uncharacterized protein n=1 Tax=Russula earlei TaxID=71964 RepID=A0ACC0TT06_9AGAM|nr:hypothetical protein F5148DRAFT_1153769 [Russula earlei]
MPMRAHFPSCLQMLICSRGQVDQQQNASERLLPHEPPAETTIVDHAANIVCRFQSVLLSLVHDEDSSSDHALEPPLSTSKVIVWVSHSDQATEMIATCLSRSLHSQAAPAEHLETIASGGFGIRTAWYNQAMHYGTHMATHMSLGLLFLAMGGG